MKTVPLNYSRSKTVLPIQKVNKEKEFIQNNDIETKKSLSFYHMFKESLYEICSNSTSHGIPNIVRANNFVTRLFWFILVCAATLGCIYCIFVSMYK